jgi:hypothetical protein
VEDTPEWSTRRVYKDQLAQMTVGEAATALPLSAVERSLQRHRVRNQPAMPDTRGDLILQGPHTVTSDGRAFLLIDDSPGQGDRIIVFATEQQLSRFVFNQYSQISG